MDKAKPTRPTLAELEAALNNEKKRKRPTIAELEAALAEEKLRKEKKHRPKPEKVKAPKPEKVKESKSDIPKETMLKMALGIEKKLPPEKQTEPEKGKEPKPEKVKEPKPEKVKEPKPEKVKEPKPEKVKEPKPEKVKEPKPEKVKEPKPKKVKEPKPEKVKEPKPEKVKKEKAPKPKKVKKEKPPKPEKVKKEKPAKDLAAQRPDKEALEQAVAQRKRRRSFWTLFRNTVFVLITVAAIAALIATLFMPVLKIYSTSMAPGLQEGDIVVSTKRSTASPGDVIAFYYNNKLFVKRVIAGPGSIVNIDEDGNVYVNDVLQDEPYVEEKSAGVSDLTYPYLVPEDAYFVLGDNRVNSADSRTGAMGCVPQENVLGKVLICVWPLSHWKIIR